MEGRNKDVVDLRRKKNELCQCFVYLYQVHTYNLPRYIHVCEFTLQQYEQNDTSIQI